ARYGDVPEGRGGVASRGPLGEAPVMSDLARLIRTLADAHVEFIIVGGVAANAHGASRVTTDVDVVYARDAENLGRVVAALVPLEPYLRGAPPGLPFEWSAD